MKPVYIYVTPFFPSPECWHGSYCYNFVRALMSDGRYDVRVFFEGKGGDYEYRGVRVHRFPVKRLKSNLLPFLYERYNQDSFLNAVRRAGVRLEDVAVCHANTANFVSYALAVKQLNSRCQTLLHHHCLSSFGLNMGILRHSWLYNMFMFPAFRKRFEQMDGHVFISEKVRDSFLRAPDTRWTSFTDYKRQMRGLPYRPVRIKHAIILYNGIDTAIFRPKPPGDGDKRPGTTFTIGCVANFMPLKGHMVLLKAILNLRAQGIGNVHLLLIGTGPERDKCLRFAADHKISFEVLPEIYPEKMPEFYGKIDLFVVPSEFEGFGCVYTEASACDVPFIACRGQGLDEVVCDGDKCSCLCDPGDDKMLASMIAEQMKDLRVVRFNRNLNGNELVSDFVNNLLGGVRA